MSTVIVDGEIYIKRDKDQTEANKLLNELYGAIWTEAFYNPVNEHTQKYAERLHPIIRRLNDILVFKS